MRDFLQDVLSGVQEGRLSKPEALRMLNKYKQSAPSAANDEYGVLLFRPFEEETAKSPSDPPGLNQDRLIIFGESIEVRADKLKCMTGNAEWLVLEFSEQPIEQRYEAYTLQIVDHLQRLLHNQTGRETLVQLFIANKEESPWLVGLYSLLLTARAENPKLTVECLEWSENGKGDIAGALEAGAWGGGSTSAVRSRHGRSYRAAWKKETVLQEQVRMPWKDRGIYLITGGAGALGLLFAEEIARQVSRPVLILIGRSATLNDEASDRIERMAALGAKVEYRQVDLSEEHQVAALIDAIRHQYGGLNGILHAAGIIRDEYLYRKTRDQVIEVLGPKVKGLVHLDQSSKDIKLDVFAVFSSVAGVYGNAGQADYATANGFMDAYTAWRQQTDRNRSGMIAINWPLWRSNGMQLEPGAEEALERETGMAAMPGTIGIRAFYAALASGGSRAMVLYGDGAKLTRFVENDRTRSSADLVEGVRLDPNLDKRTLKRLIQLFSGYTRLNPDSIDPDEPLETYGIDSIMITELNRNLAYDFGELSKTLFYEFRTLRGVADYLTATYPHQCLNWIGLAEKDTQEKINAATASSSGVTPRLFPSSESDQTVSRSAGFAGKSGQPAEKEPIAIIGMSGRYPQAEDLDAFWRNLAAGMDCITEIPGGRWPVEGFYEPNPEIAVAEGKSYSKWGGFLEHATSFDPLFFKISPLEASCMDPQERIFLESCWHALEDAGCTREHLASQYGGRVGVFAGITKTGFNLYGPEFKKQGERMLPFTSFSSVANRVSYLFNFNGPSMPIDTMCSSSLTAIHEACEHILRGECELAIAGGVNLYLHPSNYIELSAHGMLSTDGKCRSFSSDGSGFVPGEGVGVLLLKRLSQAIADGDRIHAVIRATSVNHGGKTNGYTVPNPNAQGQLIRQALDKAGIHSRTVSYIEAHGTGTKLGDPIEITGLTQAFRQDTQDNQYCAIGSVKSNIGHLEAAAGVAGVTKIVLQMKHRKLVPSLHARTLNPNIPMKNTPFMVQQELADWDRPVVRLNGKEEEYPRIAGISSFGAGGANAHIVLEEYIPPASEARKETSASEEVLILLSAANKERLRIQAERLLSALDSGLLADAELTEIAYTLQIGREALDERLAFTAASMEELSLRLRSFLNKTSDDGSIYRGHAKSDKDQLASIGADDDLASLVNRWIEHRNVDRLGALWVKGLKVDWSRMYENKPARRVSLPGYPFERKTYWLPGSGKRKEAEASPDLATEKQRFIREPKNHPEAFEHVLLTPVWEAVPVRSGPAYPGANSRSVVIIGGTAESRDALLVHYPNAITVNVGEEDDIEQIAMVLARFGIINHLFWLAPPSEFLLHDDSLLAKQKAGVLLLFRLIKALLHAGYGGKRLSVDVLTFQTQRAYTGDRINPVHASVHGLIGALAKEYPNWQIRLLDLEPGWETSIETLLTLPPDTEGNTWCLRGREWLCQRLAPVNLAPGMQHNGYRKGGVYVVIGGAGGIGEVWTAYMIRRYQAQIVWLGRRRQDESISASIERVSVSTTGPKPIYIEADAADTQSLDHAYQVIKARFGAIHGVIHAAIVLRDQSLANMQEDDFRAGLGAKIDVSVRLAQIFRKEPLDFVLFFSGMMSFARRAGQSNYAAGCTFKDAFAIRLARDWPCAVKIMNWGYWGSAGIVASDEYRARMELDGIGSITPSDAMKALETLLASPIEQMAFIKASKSVLEAGFASERLIDVIFNTPGFNSDYRSMVELPALPDLITGMNIERGQPVRPTGQAEPILHDLIGEASRLLNVHPEEIDPNAEFAEYGLDTVQLAELLSKLNRRFMVEAEMQAFTDWTTLNQIAQAVSRFVGRSEITP